jgi:beta-N-acetylhexosaminidase
MHIHEKIGPLFVMTLGAETSSVTSITTHLKGLLKEYRPSGFILHPSAFLGRRQHRSYLDELQAENRLMGNPGPLIICGDHRGGDGTNTEPRRGGLEAPAPMAQCALDQDAESACETIGRLVGHDALSLGFNLNLAPYADFLEQYPIEGFQFGQVIMGRDPKVNASVSRGLVRGFRQAGLACTYCTFPGGYGSLPKDPHFFTGTILADDAELNERYLPAVRAAIAEGVEAIMLSHWVFPAWDLESRPGTFSPPVIAKLRDELGFTGLIMTDAVGMRSSTDLADNDSGEVCVRALEAGADLLLCSRPTDYRAVEKAILSGRLSAKRIEEALSRVAHFQASLNQGSEPGAMPNAEAQRQLQTIIERSLTWVRQPKQTLRPGHPVTVIAPQGNWEELMDTAMEIGGSLVRSARLYNHLYFYYADPILNHKTRLHDLLEATSVDVPVLLGTDNSDDLKLAEALQQQGRKVHVLHSGFAAEAGIARGVSSLLLCYARQPMAIQAGVRALFGLIKAPGKLEAVFLNSES